MQNIAGMKNVWLKNLIIVTIVLGVIAVALKEVEKYLENRPAAAVTTRL
jgi:Tfp pilus assembly major pilin PilA